MKIIKNIVLGAILITFVTKVNAIENAPSIITVDKPIKQINTNNLDSADGMADELLKIKRKVELEKANAELKKLQSPPIINGKPSSGTFDNAQTTVNGVAINQQGEKIAWLQFADGGTLTVNIGSKVGQYTVSDISMTGVILAASFKKGKGKSVFLKRAYYAPEKSQQNNLHENTTFVPSPIVTNANTSGKEIVPSIFMTR